MRLTAFIMLGFLLSSALQPRLLAGELGAPTDVSFSAAYDGTTQRYVRLLPTDFDSASQYDIVIGLHGHGADRWQFSTGTSVTERAFRDAAANHNMIVITPDYRATTSWMGPAAEADVVQIIQDLKRQYHVGKTIVCGASMGGASSLAFTALHPDMVDGVWSANGLANFVGYPNFQDAIATSFGGTYEQVPQQYIKRSAINSPQSFTMPLSITAGGLDTVVPPQSVLQLADTVKNTNPHNPKVTTIYRPNDGHYTNYVDSAMALEYVIQNAKGIDTDLHPITINTSFEYQKLDAGGTASGEVSGWTTIGTSVGVMNLAASDYSAKFDDPMPDGTNAAFVRNGSLHQFVGTTVRAGTYHLSLNVGVQKGGAAAGVFQAGFMVAASNAAADDELAWAGSGSSASDSALAAGKWSSVDLDWNVGPDSAAIGKYLYLDLAGAGGNAVYFDGVSVTFMAVPEPGAIMLCVTGAVGVLVYAWRKRR
jgi:pimeloyl-ACP methyl ester carboxylesterase